MQRIIDVISLISLGDFDPERTIIPTGDAPDEFARRVTEAIEWATSMHAALRLELSYDADPGWQWMCAAVRGAWAQLDEQVCRTALPTTPAELALDRRRRVA